MANEVPSGQGVADIIASKLKVNRYPLLRMDRDVTRTQVAIHTHIPSSLFQRVLSQTQSPHLSLH